MLEKGSSYPWSKGPVIVKRRWKSDRRRLCEYVVVGRRVRRAACCSRLCRSDQCMDERRTWSITLYIWWDCIWMSTVTYCHSLQGENDQFLRRLFFPMTTLAFSCQQIKPLPLPLQLPLTLDGHSCTVMTLGMLKSLDDFVARILEVLAPFYSSQLYSGDLVDC